MSWGGFQLDITPDVGVRTVKFLVTGADGHPAIRYGRTILQPGAWYHVAGVFDATKRTLDVYVNGRADDGCLTGVVGNAQESSSSPAHVGRRPHRNGYEYAGAIDDLRVYSRALRAAEIAWLSRAPAESAGASAALYKQADVSCRLLAHYLDWTALASAGLFGVLLALGFVGTRQRMEGRTAVVLLAAAGGLVILHASRAMLPRYDEWIVPMLAIAGSASVLLAVPARRAAGSV
jgi:hypothetical protein